MTEGVVQEASRPRRGRRYTIWIIAAGILSLCTISFASTRAVCGFRRDNPAFSMDMTISEFMGQQNYTAQDLIEQSEQTLNRYAGLLGRANRGVWNKATYHCHNGGCELQRLNVELAIETVFPCFIDENGTTLGFTDFRFDILQNHVSARTGWYDRPTMQDAGVRLSSVSPTIDEAVLDVARTLPDVSPGGEAVIVDIHAGRDHWNIRVSETGVIEAFEVTVPFH